MDLITDITWERHAVKIVVGSSDNISVSFFRVLRFEFLPIESHVNQAIVWLRVHLAMSWKQEGS